MPINKKKLASLAAVGAGALALTTGNAEASTILYSGVLDQTVGFGSYPVTQVFKTFTASSGPSFKFKAKSTTSRGHQSRYALATPGSLVAFKFATVAHSRFQTFSSGAVWSNELVGNHLKLPFAERIWNGSSNTFGNSAFTDKYLLFQFETNSVVQYGWIEASLQMVNMDSSDPANGPNLTIISYAYDSSGALLPAGDTGPTPEPSTLAESGIAALVLGAAGLRRWRKARLIESFSRPA